VTYVGRWSTVVPPAMTDQEASLSPASLRRLDKICDAFEAALRRGEKPAVEEFLTDLPRQEASVLRQELLSLVAEYESKPPVVGSADEFMQTLLSAQVISRDDATKFWDATSAANAPASQVAGDLVEANYLTRFQADAALQRHRLALGNYILLDELGKGGMGQVYRARHRRMDRIVALKILSPEAMHSPDATDRFHREVKTIARLSHPNIVTAHDADESDGLHFLVMEYVAGRDLGVLVRRQGPLAVDQALKAVIQAATGLQYVHEQGVIHRDVKPSNLLADRRGVIKILDLGLARITTPRAVLHGISHGSITSRDMVMGTLDYMAPEQAEDSSAVDHRVDIYGLGCTLYYLLGGGVVYPAETAVQSILAHRETPIPPLRKLRDDIPDELDASFARMIAKKAEDRHEAMSQVVEDLRSCLVKKLPQDSRCPEVIEASSSRHKSDSTTPRVDGNTDSQALDTIAIRPVVHPVRRRPQRSRLLRRFWLPLVAIGLLAGGIFGVVMTVRTPTGELQIKTNDRDVRVSVTRAGRQVRIVDTKTNTTVELDEGKYEVSLLDTDNSIELDKDRITLKRGEKEIVEVIFREPPSADSPPVAIVPFDMAQAKRHQQEWEEHLNVPVDPDAPPPATAPFDTAQAKGHQEAWAHYLGVPIEMRNSVRMRLRLIPPGEFTMGSADDEHGHEANEGPQHRVHITRPYFIGVCEVTTEQYEAVMGEAPWTDKGEGEISKRGDCPATFVSWNDANDFCKKLSSLEDCEYRLLTEAEWEYACRAGSVTAWSCGDSPEMLSDHAWLAENSKAIGKTCPLPVGQKRSNAWGLHDMHGNVWERCQDWFDQYRESSEYNPVGPSEGSVRVVRGGGWDTAAQFTRSADRHGSPPHDTSLALGFRVAFTLRCSGSFPKKLDLSSTTIGNADLEPLQGLTTLQQIDLRGTLVTAIGVAGLKAALPECEILADPEVLDPVDRRVMQYVLSIGGHVRVLTAEGDEWAGGGINAANSGKIPEGTLELLLIDLWGNQQVTQEGLQGIGSLRSLTSFLCDGSAISSATLKELANTRNLRSILANRCPDAVNDDVIVAWSNLQLLHILGLQRATLGEQGVKAFASFPSLTTLHLSEGKLPDRGIEWLAEASSIADLDLRAAEFNEEELQYLSMLPLHTLNVSETRLTTLGLAHVCEIESLAWLVLSGNELTDQDLTELRTLPQLKSLWLNEIPITGTGFLQLQEIPIGVLYLGNSQVDDEGITAIGGLTELGELYLAGTNVTNDGLESITNLKQLRQLNLADTDVTNDGLRHLSSCENLHNLWLHNTNIDDAGLEHLRELQLSILNIADTKTTDAGLEHLTGLKSLKSLNLRGTEVTPAGVEKLEAALPNCEIAVGD
jgi:eukaryotic-like serine/threonine-protein kinase